MIPRVLAGTIVVALFVATVSEARPGGGDTYSADSRSDRGGDDGDASGEGDLEALVALVQLCLRYPKFGVPFLLLVIGFVVYNARGSGTKGDWDSARTPREIPTRDEVGLRSDWDEVKNVLYAGADEGARLERMSLDPIARVDPDFSAILFEDSAFRLYATAHGCRGEHRKLDELAPYLSARARKSLASRAPAGRAVTGVVIGQMRPIRVNVGRAGSVT